MRGCNWRAVPRSRSMCSTTTSPTTRPAAGCCPRAGARRDAADRGVRVRVLIDDLYTGGEDLYWLSFAAHKNVEVRLFNPFCCAREQGQGGRFLASANEWSRLNHRMHNKLFIADGAMAVIGGRNVANE